MLNNQYTVLDMFKFYYNVKIQYQPKDRSVTIPFVFLVCSICSLLILNTVI